MADEKNGAESVLDLDPEQLTPGMKQYQEVKKAYPDCLVMLRMGDFYEMFYEDAVVAARELEITLTSRGKGEKRAPLAGVPFHALDPYLGKLVKKGYKVAIVEQLEDPKKAKGLVKRGLVRIVTPGTVMESSILNEKENNYIVALTSFGEEFALASCDLTTGEFATISLPNPASFFSEFTRISPRECLVPSSLLVNQELLQRIKSVSFCTPLEDHYFKADKAREVLIEHFNLKNLDSFGLEEKRLNISVCGALLYYLHTTQKNSLSHIRKIVFCSNAHRMFLDPNTIRNLELLGNMKDGSTRGTLLSVLDKTETSLGSRLLKRWIKEPLLQKQAILARLDAVEMLNKNVIVREEIKMALAQIGDMERLVSRINYGNATPRDVLALRNSLVQIPSIKQSLSVLPAELLMSIASMDQLEDIAHLVGHALRDDVPLTTREGGMIRDGFHQELDELHTLKHHGRQYLQKLEEQERQNTGITSLKIGYTAVFGYFIEVTRRNVHLVPPHYIRRQTTANAERYITEELKKEEEKILNAQEKINELEYALFQEIIAAIARRTDAIQDAASKIATVDVLCSFATIAQQLRYSKPEFAEQSAIYIVQGRHPVIEAMEERFIANDITLNAAEMMIITGPNMSGKSTFMRQVALIVLLAQLGSFVPAEKAILGIVDRIFTRVGASDDLSSGQSTFMVEMTETAAILNQATENSLIILDEIGRGTSTFDGVAIAWSVAEFVYNRVRAKTLFSTHYHVLNKLQERFPKIKNYNLAVREVNDQIIFLRKLVEGGTDQSYGVHVAKLAGMPFEVVERAQEIQEILERDDEMVRKIKAKKLEDQMSLERF